MKEQLIISEIDVERIRAERRINTTFAANQANLGDKKAVSIATEFVNSKELTLTRKFNAHPFVPQGIELNEHCEEVFSIQVAGLAQRLVHTLSLIHILLIEELPDVPVLIAICALVSHLYFCMNFSLRRFHINPTDQKDVYKRQP